MIYFVVLISLLSGNVLAALADPLLVKLANGMIRGRDNGVYYSYESIPFAEPPLGELRYELPQPFTRQWTEVFDATKPPVLCLQWDQFSTQPNKLAGSEDCLTVNVYKPKNSTRKSFPVIAVIPGGAFMFGGAPEIGHEHIMKRGNVIVVNINYRLGTLGFVSTNDVAFPGNLGLKDQRLALQWIKNNIARFGGEPENMLVFGQSAGGASVHLHLLNEDFQKLAKVAVSLSGTALNPWAVQPASRLRAFELGRTVGCGLLNNSTALKKCLKTKDAGDIVRAVAHFLLLDFVPIIPFGPVVEPADAPQPFLTQKPMDIIKSGKTAQVPWLSSYLSEDGIFNAAILLRKQSNGRELIEVLNSRWFELAPNFFIYRDTSGTLEKMDDRSRDLRQNYLGNQNFTIATYLNVQRLFTDLMFRNATQLAVDLHRRYGKSPVYSYVFNSPGERGYGQILSNRTDFHFGTAHSDDLNLIFDNGHIHRPFDKVISTNFIKMLEKFVTNKTLTYGNCTFQDNIGQDHLQLVSITRHNCTPLQVDYFP